MFRALLALALAAPPAGAVQLRGGSFEHLGASSQAVLRDPSHLREKVLLRFAHVDKNGDGVISLEEMKLGFGHEPAHVGEGVLRQMIVDCAGGSLGATTCSLADMRRSLEKWVTSASVDSGLSLLQTGGGFHSVDSPDAAGQLCGPSLGTPAPGLEGVQCRVQGAKCILGGGLVAWSLSDICRNRACICEATAETKRLAKLGVTGAAAVTTAYNFTDPHDVPRVPDCGSGWTAHPVNGRVDDIRASMSAAEDLFVNITIPKLAPTIVKYMKFPNSTIVDTEVAVYKSSRHKFRKNGEPGKVCMISWQATRSPGDWISNLLLESQHFPYGPKGVEVKVPKGLLLTYESVREKLKNVFEQECCNDAFRAEKVIVSGHSHGGAMAEISAIDIVTNWECPKGRDLGAEDMAAILVAPHTGMFNSAVLNKVFSCNDPANCLAGRVVTMATHGDYVADKYRVDQQDIFTMGVPGHPSHVEKLPCPAIPEGANFENESTYADFWCHGMYNYLPLTEEKLVGEAAWGSSCDGTCGQPNKMVQCNQWALMAQKGCVDLEAQYQDLPTTCPSDAWRAESERCDCPVDPCPKLTKHGCKA